LKVLVTGGAGFIGSHLVERLLDEGHEVNVLDNLRSGDMENLNNCVDNPAFHFIEGDLRNEDEVREAVEGMDAVFHEAAITSVPFSVENPELTEEVNFHGTVNLLEKCEECEVEKFVFASTCAVYGDPDTLPIDEETSPAPTSPYAESKLSAEKEILERESLSPVVFRYFNVYGPRQGDGAYAGVISKFLNRLVEGKPPIIFGDGKQTRDFIFVEDVVRANIRALEVEAAEGEILNLGNGKSVSINELCDILLEVTDNDDVGPDFRPPREGDIEHSRADVSKVEERLDFRPEFSLKEGLSKLSEKY